MFPPVRLRLYRVMLVVGKLVMLGWLPLLVTMVVILTRVAFLRTVGNFGLSKFVLR